MRKAKGSFRHPQTPDAKRIAHSFFSLPYHLTAAAAGWFFFAQKSGWASAKGQNSPERRKELCTTSFANWTFPASITGRTPRRALNYLRSIHRHVFNITARIPVTHDNRDLEIIQTQNRIHHFLSDRFGDENGHMMLGSMSCEMLAKLIADTFGCTEVTVQEDGQGGGVYVRE